MLDIQRGCFKLVHRKFEVPARLELWQEHLFTLGTRPRLWWFFLGAKTYFYCTILDKNICSTRKIPNQKIGIQAETQSIRSNSEANSGNLHEIFAAGPPKVVNNGNQCETRCPRISKSVVHNDKCLSY